MSFMLVIHLASSLPRKKLNVSKFTQSFKTTVSLREKLIVCDEVILMLFNSDFSIFTFFLNLVGVAYI